MKYLISTITGIFAGIYGLHTVLAPLPQSTNPPNKMVNIDSIESASKLHEVFRGQQVGIRTKTLTVGTRKYLWVTADEGSGVYLVHGLLYEQIKLQNRDKWVMLLHISPRDWKSLQAKVVGSRIEVIAQMTSGKQYKVSSYSIANRAIEGS